MLAQLRALGLEPAGSGGSYLQHFTLVQERLAVSQAHFRVLNRAAIYGRDYTFRSVPASLNMTAKVLVLDSAEPQAVSAFVGRYGSRLPSAAVLVRAGADEAMAAVPALTAAGARTVLTVGTVEEGEPSWRTRTEGRTLLTELSGPPLTLGTVTPALAQQLQQAGRVTLRLPLEQRRVTAANVLARLPGRDPQAPALMIGAHLDHLGVIEGHTYPGADDNASGVATALLTARNLLARAERPAGDVYFAFWTAEERGTLGSAQFVTHPTVPLQRLGGYINLDMVGRNTTSPDLDDVMLLGYQLPPGEEALRKAFGGELESFPYNRLKLQAKALLPSHGLAANTGVQVLSGQRLDLRPLFYLSTDTMNFIYTGVPSLSLSTGMHADYHESSDTPEKINYGKLVKLSQLLAELAHTYRP